jgi:drug/metabolite transporter (DMT)-like permease
MVMKSRVWTALVALYIVWGSTYLAIRFAVETIPPFLMAGSRFLVSGLILYIWRRLAGDPNPTQRQWRSAAIIGLLLLLGGNGIVSWAEQHVPSGIAALVIASIPLWIAVIDSVRPGGTRSDWRIVLGLLIGFSGIALLMTSSGGLGSSDGKDLLGFLALLCAALLWSVGSIYGRDAEMPESSLMGTGIEMLVGAAGLFLVGTFAGEWRALDIAAVSAASLIGLVYLVLFGSLVGFVSYTWLIRKAPLSLVSTYAYVNPVVAVFLGAWLGSEVINARIILSAMIIIGSVVVINLSRQTRIRNDEEPAPSPAD